MTAKLVTNPNQLKQMCQPVSKKKGLEIGRELFKFLRNYNKEYISKQGIGLAAPQLGIYYRVCVLALPKCELVLVNPVITQRSEATVRCKEGCLSLPGVSVDTYRYIWVEVGTDNLGSPQVFGVDLTRVSDKSHQQMMLEAMCVQHEIAHVFGLLITDFTTQDSPDPLTWHLRTK